MHFSVHKQICYSIILGIIKYSISPYLPSHSGQRSSDKAELETFTHEHHAQIIISSSLNFQAIKATSGIRPFCSFHSQKTCRLHTHHNAGGQFAAPYILRNRNQGRSRALYTSKKDWFPSGICYCIQISAFSIRQSQCQKIRCSLDPQFAFRIQCCY